MYETTATGDSPAAGAAAPVPDLTGEVIEAFVSMADTLVAGYDSNDLLAFLVERAVTLLGMSAAGILLVDRTGRLQLVASSSEEISDLELFALSSDDGPCLDCFAASAPVLALRPGQAEQRWPAFARRMRAQGLASVASVPLHLRAQTLGALGMFSRSWEHPRPGAVRIAQGFADIATIALLHERALQDSRTLTAQLQGALDSRVLIEQAKGVIATQLGTTVDEAFRILRATARHRGERLADLSSDLVHGRADAATLDS